MAPGSPYRASVHLDEFAYDLPDELVAQRPAEPRDASRLLVDLDGVVSHHHTRDLPSFLRRFPPQEDTH